jgi:hypothetical protein
MQIYQAPPMARKPFVVNDALREKVRHLAGLGVSQDDIARIVQCSPKTLRKRCRDDLDCGAVEANAIVSNCLFAAAKGGNIAAQIFWLKSRARWRQRDASDRRTATPRPIHRWCSYCPTTVETRSWSASESITSTDNAGAEMARSLIDCTGPQNRVGALPTGADFAGTAQRTASTLEA